jgi:hypothetical protein
MTQERASGKEEGMLKCCQRVLMYITDHYSATCVRFTAHVSAFQVLSVQLS